MITVTVSINNNPIFARTAHRIEGKNGEECKYKVDTGDIIKHNTNDGAVCLAKKMLDTIKGSEK